MPRGNTRDYVYVGDVSKANILALESGDNEVVNIGTGKELFIEDIYYEVEKIYGVKIPLVRERERTGDVRRSALNCDKARGVLGWKAETDLMEGLRMTYLSRRA
jgi:UDP-glucose 4-epimerase